MSHLRFRPLLLAAVLALMLPLGADAAASTNTAVTSQSGDGATLTLSAKAKRSFSGQHVSLTAQRPATRRKSTYALPDSSGKWNFAKATGTLNLKGVLHVVLGKRSVAMKSVTFTRPAKGNGQVTVKLAGHKVQLFTVTGKVKVKHSGATEILSGMTAKLTKAGRDEARQGPAQERAEQRAVDRIVHRQGEHRADHRHFARRAGRHRSHPELELGSGNRADPRFRVAARLRRAVHAAAGAGLGWTAGAARHDHDPGR